MFNIVLLEPEIPSNTGNIGRTCVVTNSRLHLVGRLGFDLSEKAVARSGMDYWKKVSYKRYLNYHEFMEEMKEKNPKAKIWYATTKAKQCYSDVSFGPDDYIMFGKESAGIPEEILVEHEEDCIRIPMGKEERSLNLANSVAIVLYEALRQNAFPGLDREGELHELSWKEKSCGER
jgi:tRNA (cytidine/uridine-2'-O-)-methyltransferase